MSAQSQTNDLPVVTSYPRETQTVLGTAPDHNAEAKAADIHLCTLLLQSLTHQNDHATLKPTWIWTYKHASTANPSGDRWYLSAPVSSEPNLPVKEIAHDVAGLLLSDPGIKGAVERFCSRYNWSDVLEEQITEVFKKFVFELYIEALVCFEGVEGKKVERKRGWLAQHLGVGKMVDYIDAKRVESGETSIKAVGLITTIQRAEEYAEGRLWSVEKGPKRSFVLGSKALEGLKKELIGLRRPIVLIEAIEL